MTIGDSSYFVDEISHGIAQGREGSFSIVQFPLFIFTFFHRGALQLDLDTALGGPKGAEPRPDHGWAVGGFILPGGLLQALSTYPVGRNGCLMGC